MRLKEILKEGNLSPIVKGEGGVYIVEEPLHGFSSKVSDLLVLRGANILEFIYNIGKAKKKYTQTQATQTQATQSLGTQDMDDEDEDVRFDVDNNEEMEEEAAAAAATEEHEDDERVETLLQPDNISTNLHMCSQCITSMASR